MDCVPPACSCRFFMHTSAWIFFLAVLAVHKMRIFAILLGASSMASAMHWRDFKIDSLCSVLDRGLAWSVFAYMCLGGQGIVLWSCLVVAALSFWQGRQAFFSRRWKWHLVWHATFRFCAFWSVCVFIRFTGLFFVLGWSVVYWGHFGILFKDRCKCLSFFRY